jgi:Domain of unknown function (DUF4328)
MELSEYKSASKIAKATVVLLLTTAVCNFVFTALQVTNITLFDGLSELTGSTTKTSPVFTLIVGFFSLALILISYSTNIVFLVWQHRAAKNLRALNENASTHTPGWHVGWWFVPFASLIMPLRWISELANGSKPESVSDETYVADQSPSNLTGFWWFFYLFSTIVAIGNGFFAITLTKNPENWQYYLISLVVFECLYITAAILVVLIVRNIDSDQEASSKLVGNKAKHQSPPPPPIFNNETND